MRPVWHLRNNNLLKVMQVVHTAFFNKVISRWRKASLYPFWCSGRQQAPEAPSHAKQCIQSLTLSSLLSPPFSAKNNALSSSDNQREGTEGRTCMCVCARVYVCCYGKPDFFGGWKTVFVPNPFSRISPPVWREKNDHKGTKAIYKRRISKEFVFLGFTQRHTFLPYIKFSIILLVWIYGLSFSWSFYTFDF